MGATPRLLELEDVRSGRIRRVEWTDPGLDTNPRQARDRQDPIDEQATTEGALGCASPPSARRTFVPRGGSLFDWAVACQSIEMHEVGHTKETQHRSDDERDWALALVVHDLG
jgi:hypothetical protein